MAEDDDNVIITDRLDIMQKSPTIKSLGSKTSIVPKVVNRVKDKVTSSQNAH